MNPKSPKQDSLCNFPHYLRTLRLTRAIDDLATYRNVMDTHGIDYGSRIKVASGRRMEIPTTESWRFQQLNQNLKNYIEYIQECQGRDMTDWWQRQYFASGDKRTK